jgi:hypothetical protein
MVRIFQLNVSGLGVAAAGLFGGAAEGWPGMDRVRIRPATRVRLTEINVRFVIFDLLK